MEFDRLCKFERFINGNYYDIRDQGFLGDLYTLAMAKLFADPSQIWVSILRNKKLTSWMRAIIDEIQFRVGKETDYQHKIVLMAILEDNALATYLPYFKIVTERVMEENRRLNRTKKNKKTQAQAARSAMKKRKPNPSFPEVSPAENKPDPSMLLK